MRKGKKNTQLWTGLGLLGVMLVGAVAFALFGPMSVDMHMDKRLEPPGDRFWLGTGPWGRDLLSCCVQGAGISLVVGLAVVVVCALGGGILGVLAGYLGGVGDTVVMRVVDVVLAFPGILPVVALAAVFPPGPVMLILVLALFGWAGYARLVRGEVLKYREREFILAARAYNAGTGRIIFRHLLPLVLPLILVQASLDISAVILMESGLNFLGIGFDPEIPTLGQLINAGRDYLFDQPRLILVPGGLLFCIVTAFSLVGAGLRKTLTPS